MNHMYEVQYQSNGRLVTVVVLAMSKDQAAAKAINSCDESECADLCSVVQLESDVIFVSMSVSSSTPAPPPPPTEPGPRVYTHITTRATKSRGLRITSVALVVFAYYDLPGTNKQGKFEKVIGTVVDYDIAEGCARLIADQMGYMKY